MCSIELSFTKTRSVTLCGPPTNYTIKLVSIRELPPKNWFPHRILLPWSLLRMQSFSSIMSLYMYFHFRKLVRSHKSPSLHYLIMDVKTRSLLLFFPSNITLRNGSFIFFLIDNIQSFWKVASDWIRSKCCQSGQNVRWCVRFVLLGID